MAGRLFNAGVRLELRDGLSRSLGRAQERLGDFSQRAEQVADRWDRQADRFLEGGTRLAGAGLAMLAPIGLATREAMSLEEALADVRKVTGATDEELGGLARSLRRIDTTTPTEGLAGLAAAGAQMGVPLRQLDTFATEADRVAVAFDLLPEVAGASIGKLANIFEQPIDRVSELTDPVNALSDTIAAKAPDILDFLTRAGGIGRTLGLTAQEISAYGGALIATGTAPERAATGFNILLTRLNNAQSLTRRGRQALATLGLEAETLSERMRDDAAGAIREFLARVAEAEDPVGALSEIVGQEAAPKIALLTNNLGALDEAMGLATDRTRTAGSVQQEFESRTSTSTGKLGKFKKNLSDVGTVIGNVVLPPLNRLLEKGKAFLGTVEAWAEANPTLTKTLVGATVGVGGLLTVVGGGLTTIGLFYRGIAGGVDTLGLLAETISKKVVPKLVRGLGVLRAGLASVGIAFNATGIGAVLTGIAIAGLLVYKNWDLVKSFFAGFYSEVAPGLEPTLTVFEKMWNLGKFVLSGIGRLLELIVEPANNSAEALDGARKSGAWFGRVFNLFVLKPIDLFLGMLSQIWRSLETVFGTLGKLPDVMGGGHFAQTAEDMARMREAVSQGQTFDEAFPSGDAARAGRLAADRPPRTRLAGGQEIPLGGTFDPSLTLVPTRPEAPSVALPPPEQRVRQQVTYSPQVTIQGDADRRDVEAALDRDRFEFRRMLQQTNQDQRREVF